MSLIEKHLERGVNFTKAVGCYLCLDDQILLGLRKKVSNGLGVNLISGLGGKVGDVEGLEEETDDDALIRELQEEIGVTPTSFRNLGRIRFIFPHKPKWNQEVSVYVVDGWQGDPIETEAIKPLWFPINEIPFDKMWDDNYYWVPRVLNGVTVNATFLLGEENQVIEHYFEDVPV